MHAYSATKVTDSLQNTNYYSYIASHMPKGSSTFDDQTFLDFSHFADVVRLGQISYTQSDECAY